MSNEKIKNHSVWVATINSKGEMINKYVPLLEVEVAKDLTLGKYLEDKDKKIEELEKKVLELGTTANEAVKSSKDIKNYFATILKQIGGLKDE